MPMLHGCAFQGCETLTLSVYCLEHELFARAENEAERTQGSQHGAATADGVAGPQAAA
jgi:hypothetical protein